MSFYLYLALSDTPRSLSWLSFTRSLSIWFYQASLFLFNPVLIALLTVNYVSMSLPDRLWFKLLFTRSLPLLSSSPWLSAFCLCFLCPSHSLTSSALCFFMHSLMAFKSIYVQYIYPFSSPWFFYNIHLQRTEPTSPDLLRLDTTLSSSPEYCTLQLMLHNRRREEYTVIQQDYRVTTA